MRGDPPLDGRQACMLSAVCIIADVRLTDNDRRCRPQSPMPDSRWGRRAAESRPAPLLSALRAMRGRAAVALAPWRRAIALAALCALPLVAGCGRDPPHPGRIDPIDLGRLVVAVTPGPDTYFVDVEGKEAGFEYDLVRRLANALGVSLEIKVIEDHDEALAAGEDGSVHIVAVGANGQPPPGAL